jgi:hypothetical protein
MGIHLVKGGELDEEQLLITPHLVICCSRPGVVGGAREGVAGGREERRSGLNRSLQTLSCHQLPAHLAISALYLARGHQTREGTKTYLVRLFLHPEKEPEVQRSTQGCPRAQSLRKGLLGGDEKQGGG